MFSSGYDIGDIADEDVFAEEAEKLVAHPFTAALDALDAYPIPTRRRAPRATRSAAASSSRSPATCGIAADGIKLGMPPAKLGLVYSHTGLRRFIDAIGVAAHARAVPARPQRRRARPRCAGASSTRSSPADDARGARRSSWPRELAANAPLSLARQQARDPRAAATPRARSTPTSSASWSSCARRASPPRTCARACARSARSARPRWRGPLGPAPVGGAVRPGSPRAAAARIASRMRHDAGALLDVRVQRPRGDRLGGHARRR